METVHYWSCPLSNDKAFLIMLHETILKIIGVCLIFLDSATPLRDRCHRGTDENDWRRSELQRHDRKSLERIRADSALLAHLDEKQDVKGILIPTNTSSSSAWVYSQSVIMAKYFAIMMTDCTLSLITQWLSHLQTLYYFKNIV